MFKEGNCDNPNIYAIDADCPFRSGKFKITQDQYMFTLIK